jgi:SAM-dependent methyltransferase
VDLRALLGQIDIYLLDQILRGRIRPGLRVLDAGCGTGRNIRYLLREGYEVYAADSDADAIAEVRRLASQLAPRLLASNFRAEAVESMTFEDACAEVVISSAVLHFARDDHHFLAMLNQTWRVLAPGGLLFCRLASTIGMPERMRPIGHNRYMLPDRSERYLVDEDKLLRLTRELGGTLADPLKTTVVQDQRCMTTWVVRKR